MYNGLFHTLIGASHLAKGTVCQDASDFGATEKYAIAVVADGHGSKRHFRSDVGSKLAVKACMEAVEAYMADPEEFDEGLREDPKGLIRRIEKNIILRWNLAVREHAGENPFTDQEKLPFTEEKFKELRLESIYGTTLICAVITEDYTFGMQIGDGSLVVVDEDAEADMPIIDDESAPANLTASLCNSNAIDLFNQFFIPDQSLAVFVSTDGLYTSFRSSEDFLDYHSIIASHLDKPTAFDAIVQRNLEKRTHYGTQDDISFACAYDPALIVESMNDLKAQVERNKLRAEIRHAEAQAKIQKQRLKNTMHLREDASAVS
ncbi:MAG: protein phosphatase 2C domain-containing protein [Oscillospiraceae bacterium]|nr:protein phosphatase 2C domain-containing protein [Oscillospiraceae bacterium]